MATLNEIKKVLIAQGVHEFCFENTEFGGKDAFHVRFYDLPNTAAMSAALKPFFAQIDQTDKGVLFITA